uniref:Uncharacterized protein n=1 Tax=Romanomermis culicivorax TaxID=13658 RepID=A0A915K292_ROMCU
MAGENTIADVYREFEHLLSGISGPGPFAVIAARSGWIKRKSKLSIRQHEWCNASLRNARELKNDKK